MVSTHPPISNSSSIFIRLWKSFRAYQLQLVSTSRKCFKAFLIFWQVRVFLFIFFDLCGPLGRQNPLYGKFSFFFFLIITRSDLLTGIKWSLCILNSPRVLYVSFSKTNTGLYISQLEVESNFNFLHNSQRNTFPTQSCQVLYSFCASLQHSLIMWLLVSSQSPHDLHLSIFILTQLVLMALFSVAIWRDSVSLIKFPFHSHVQVLSWEISWVCYLKYPYSFFQFLFPCYWCSVDLYIACAVSGRYNLSFFALFNGVFNVDESTLSLMLASPLTPFFFFFSWRI